MAVEVISLKQLKKAYIDNHDVMCNNCHCRYMERISIYTGKTVKQYEVYSNGVIGYPIYAFKTLSELKAHIIGK